MKNIKLLSPILKKTNELITSNEYKDYSLGNSFLRNGKYVGGLTCYFLDYAL